jgi:predicted MFS family arabinose efflux permease
VALAIAGVGGVAGAVLAGPLRRRLPPRVGVLIEPWVTVVFVPCLLLCRSAFTVGLEVAIDLLPIALSSSIVVGRRLALTPDALRGRVQASSAFIAGSIVWVGPPVVGYLFQDAGETAAVLVVTAWALLVALLATASPGLRRVPDAVSSARG